MMKTPSQKTVLAFDTAMTGISVGVIATNGYTVSRQEETERGQASLLIPLIQEVLEEAQIGFNDLDLITATMGPGSFTGLRIGLTTAKILSLSLNIPLIGLNTLDVMAHHYDTQKPLLIVLETKRQDFYAQYFNEDFDTGRTHLTNPFSALGEQVIEAAPCASFDVGGDCLARFKSSISKDLSLLDPWCHPDPIIMAQMALMKFEQGHNENEVKPIYLRDADVSVSKKQQRKLAKA